MAKSGIYPSFERWFKEGGRPVSSTASINVSMGVSAVRGDWIGLNLYVMAPDADTAEEFIPALAAVLAKYGFATVSKEMLAQLGEAVRGDDPCEVADIWPKAAGPLTRKGHNIHRAPDPKLDDFIGSLRE